MKKKILIPIILIIIIALIIGSVIYTKTKKEDYKTYNIYIMEDTLPTLFANMDMVHQKDVPSYVWYQRKDTLDNEYLKNMFSNLVLSEHIGDGNAQNFRDTIKPEIQDYVNKALQDDSKAHFNIYVTAEYYWMEILAIEELGIPEDQINVTMYSCGTVDYVFNQEITKADKYETFLREKERFENNVARISLVGEDPKVFKLVKPERLSKYNKARVEAFSPYKKNYNNNDTAWCIAAVPTKKWAQAIFPNESPTQAVSKLWDAIYKTCRIDESTNTVEKWKDHIAELKAHADKLNSYAFKELRYKNSLGTDLTIGLTEGHIWCSAEALQKSLQKSWTGK